MDSLEYILLLFVQGLFDVLAFAFVCFILLYCLLGGTVAGYFFQRAKWQGWLWLGVWVVFDLICIGSVLH